MFDMITDQYHAQKYHAHISLYPHTNSAAGHSPVTSIIADSSHCRGLLGSEPGALDRRDPHHLKAALKQHLGSQSSIKAGEGTIRNPSCDSHGWGGACSSTSIGSESDYMPFDAAVTLTKCVVLTNDAEGSINPPQDAAFVMLAGGVAPQAPVQQQAADQVMYHTGRRPQY